MTNENAISPHPDLQASGDDPWLGVHMLSEFVFCPRAGTIEFEREREDEGEEEEPRASVNYMPHHELAALIRDIEGTTRTMMRWIPVPCISLLLTIVGGWWLGWCPAVVGLLATAGLAKPVFTALGRLRELKELYEHVQSRKAVEPDPGIAANQEIDWWELRKAGFEPFVPPQKYDDENLRLTGRPWRILRRGNTLIPVFKKRMDGPNPETIYPQHYVRMAAYCHLLEHAADAESPYGIVLFGYTYRGFALNAGATRGTVSVELRKARRVIRDSQAGQTPDPPKPKFCRGCPHGKPFVLSRSTKTESLKLIPKNAASGVDGREYRSDCGDRFAWIPPHEKARQKQL